MSKSVSSSKKKSARKTSSPSLLREIELLLEIGTEELPYQFIAPGLRSLHEGMETMLQSQRLPYGQIRAMGTPRRLVLMVEQLATQQQSAVKETMGPSKAVAFDQAGHPTKAAIGFAASQGVPVEALQVRQTAKGEYVYAVKQDKGQSTTAVLTQHIPGLIAKLSFPKAMQWNETGVRFARPVRWLAALCGRETLPIEFAGVKAGRISQAHRFMKANTPMSANGFPVRSIHHYLKETERHSVIIDQERRREMIVEQLSALAMSVGGQLHQDEELLEQAVYTVEYPHTIMGSFQPDYLILPKEILMTAMKEHQGYFSLVDQKGLLPNFLAVTNMNLSNMQLIREGNERVLAARLADARFFYEEDRKIPLADRLEKLEAVTFHQKIGTQFERSMRIKELAGYLAEQLGNHELAQVAQRAAELSKTDLLTGIVGEFPTLQGIMGGEYAKHDGERPDVAEAIAEHYLPRGMEGEIPRTLPGKVLSLTDRLDKIVSFFWVGVIPKGSEDPYALRRDALSIVRIMIEGRFTLDLHRAIEKAEEGLKKSGITNTVIGMQQDPIDFIIERLRFYAGTSGSIGRDDVIAAILTHNNVLRLSLVDLLDRMTALQTVTSRPEFDPLIVGFKRAHRLSEKEQWDRKPVDPVRFGHQAEVDLYQTLQTANGQFTTSMQQGQYGRALDVLVAMKQPIDAFFTGVMVNAEDPAIRANRLSLLKDVDDLFMAFADFSQIVVQGS